MSGTPATPTAAGERVTVLIVDDSEDQRSLLRRYFERAGCAVTAVVNGEEAIIAYTAATPDLTVIDLILPGITGWELAERMRTDRPECVVVITSVLDASEYPAAHATLPKPFTGAQVRKLLRDLVPKWTAA
jgi:CheY-like chemotaxis protein